MTTTNPTSSSFIAPIAQPPGARGNDELGQAAFLRLMTAQVQMQDPFKPADQTQMIAQMAQFSQVAGIADMNSALTTIADSIAAQTALLTEIAEALPAAVAAPTPAPPPPVITPEPPTI